MSVVTLSWVFQHDCFFYLTTQRYIAQCVYGFEEKKDVIADDIPSQHPDLGLDII